MNKFYINDSNGRKYYAYKYERDEVKYISLERKNISLLLSSIAKDKIRNIHFNVNPSLKKTFQLAVERFFFHMLLIVFLRFGTAHCPVKFLALNSRMSGNI